MGTSNSSHATIIPLWNEQTAYIQWIFVNKGNFPNTAIEHGARIGLIGMYCSIIEGVCRYVLIENLKTNPNLKHIDDRRKKFDEVEYAAWKRYNTLFNDIFKNHINFYVGKHFESINMLFKLRNSVLHGNAMTLNEESDEGVQTTTIDGGKYQDVYDFLVSKGVITDAIENIDSNPSSLFSDAAMKYYLDETISFIENLNSTDLLDDFSKRLLNDYILRNLKSI